MIPPDPIIWSDFFIGWLFGHLLIGSLIWMAAPVSHTDFALSRYCARNNRLPPAGFWGVAIVVAIVLWPKVVMMLIRRTRS